MAGFPPATPAPRADASPVAKQDAQPSTGNNTIETQKAQKAKMIVPAPKRSATINGQDSAQPDNS